MRSVIRFFAKLYPAPWRAKYGAEFDQLLADSNLRWLDVANVFTGAITMQISRGSLAKVGLTGVIAGVLSAAAMAYFAPVEWQATATLQGAPKPIVKLWDDFIQASHQTVNNRHFLFTLIQNNNLYPNERARAPIEDIVENMRRRIRIEPLQPNQILIKFEYPDREAATKVVASIAADIGAYAHLEPGDSSSLRKSRWQWIAFPGILTAILTALIAMWLSRRRVANA